MYDARVPPKSAEIQPSPNCLVMPEKAPPHKAKNDNDDGHDPLAPRFRSRPSLLQAKLGP